MNNSNAIEDNIMLNNFNPMELAKQVESLQKQVNLLHLEAIGAKVDPMHTDNKSKRFDLKKILNYLNFFNAFFFLMLNRQLLLDHLNESKKYLNETKGKTKENVSKNSETSIVFKLFRDLESDEMEKANKV